MQFGGGTLLFYQNINFNLNIESLYLLSSSTLQVKVLAQSASPFENQLFWFRETFFHEVASSKILGTMMTKMVSTWRADIFHFIFTLGVWGQDCLSAVTKKAEMTKRSHCHCFSDFEGTLD